MWHWIKRVFGAVGAIYTVVDVIALMGIVFLPFDITGSKTLQGFIATFGILGGILGYFLTATAWAGKGRLKCLRRRNLYLVIFFLSLFTFIGTLVILRPQIAMEYLLARKIREFLLRAMPLPNFIVGISAGSASFFLVGAITLSSPRLAQIGWD